MNPAFTVDRGNTSGANSYAGVGTQRPADWLLEIGVSVLCEHIEAISERFGFRGFGAVDVYNDRRAIIETSWDRKTEVFELGISDTLLRTVDEQQLTSLLVRAMAFAAIGCHETLAGLDEEAVAASQSRWELIWAIRLRRILEEQREMRHALEFLADLKAAELGFESGLIRFLETHKKPLNQRLEFQLGWDTRLPSNEYPLERLREVVKLRQIMDA